MTEETVDYTAEANLLIEEMNKQPEDIHEVQIRLRQKIAMMRAEGLPIPQNFLELEAQLDQDLSVDR